MTWMRAAIMVLAGGAIACSGSREDQRAAQSAFWSQQVNRDRVDQFAYANTRFALLHELGHFIFHEYGVPLGKDEEDAADRFAVRVMTPPPTALAPPAAESTSSPTASDLVWVGYWWIEQGLARQQSRTPIAWNDEHRPSEERGEQVLCLLYGSNPARYAVLADEFRLSDQRRAACVVDAASNTARWNAVIGDYMADPTERAANRARYAKLLGPLSEREPGSLAARVLEPSQVEAPVLSFMRLFSYEPYLSPEAQAAPNEPTLFWHSKDFLERRQMLEGVVDDMLALTVPPGKTLPRVAAMGCEGEANAKYAILTRNGHSLQTIYICYPIVDSFAWSARNLFWAIELQRTSR